MKNLSSEIAWYEQQPRHRSMELSACICVCATEGLIQAQREPERMRAFLLIAVFMEQFIRSHFEKLHEAFCLDFAVPQLLARGGRGCASPDWLLNHELGFDDQLNWPLIRELASGARREVYTWLSQRYAITPEHFSSLLHRDITATFEARHQASILQAFQSAEDKQADYVPAPDYTAASRLPGSL